MAFEGEKAAAVSVLFSRTEFDGKEAEMEEGEEFSAEVDGVGPLLGFDAEFSPVCLAFLNLERRF